MTRRSIIVVIRGSSGTSPARLCWSSAHLVQCEPDKPSCSWTQIWVQARMPNYRLNWTARSTATQRWQRCQCWSLPSWKSPRQSQEPFGIKAAMEHWLSGTDARQSAEKPQYEAATDPASSLGWIFVSASHQTGLDTRSMTQRSIFEGIRGRDYRVRALLDIAGHRPTYGLMGKTRSRPCAMQRWQRCQCCSSLPRKRLFDLICLALTACQCCSSPTRR